MRATIMEELDYFSEKVVWDAADYGEMKSDSTSTFVRMRWVLCNKGNEASPDVRARLVACEIARNKQSQFYASTPPLEAKKFLFSRYARKRTRNSEPLQPSFVDVKKAHFNGTPSRNVYMAPPEEFGLPKPNLQNRWSVYMAQGMRV